MAVAIHPRDGADLRLLAAAPQALMGIGALFGGYSLIADAEGFGMDPAWLEHSPFGDYLVPGLFLFIVIGLGNMLGALLALGNRGWAAAAVLNGAMMFAWLTVETALVRWQGGPQGILLAVCGGSGLLMLGAGVRGGGVTALRGLRAR
ncbi:MAG: hypothetical protein AB7F65_12265 [Dehalococcoidia bacterium]